MHADRPWTPELRAQSQARGLLTFKRSQVKSLDALQEVVRSDQTISDRVRQQGLDWSTRFWDARFGTSTVKEENGNIREIDFRNTGVRDAGLMHLASEGLTHLETLWFTGTQITDEGLKRLQKLTNLKFLFLSDTRIGDAGVVHLTGLTSLKSLDLRGTKVTDAGVAELQKALPNCKIRK